MNCFYSKPKEYPIENKVKNLGWVLRFASHNLIKSVEARQENGVACTACLRVFFENGYIFQSEFLDYSVMLNWLKARRSWRGVTLHYVTYGQHFLTTKL